MAETVSIPRAFCGPPESGNGGYVCGVTARLLTDGPAEVTLRRPPPLERALRVERSASRVALMDDDAVVADAVPTELDVELPPPVSADSARRAVDAFDVARYTDSHPFRGCFTCGPDRAVGQGLRLFPAPLLDRADTAASPWVPQESLADETGLVRAEIIWAAVDCPSAFGHMMRSDPWDPIVLGRLAADIRRRPAPGEDLAVGGWLIEDQGRKLIGAAAVWAADGSVVAVSRATWIRLTPEQAAAFSSG